jgi:hypothetical protein
MQDASGAGEPGLEELIRQVRDLQSRVSSLEESSALRPPPVAPALAGSRPAAAERAVVPALHETAALVPVLGKALLAIAAAYLLRALAEARVLPLSVCIGAGILYSFFWLLMAAREAPGRRAVAMVYGATSALVLAPLLWESTVRFEALPASIAAVSLIGYTAFGLVISWRKNLDMVAWITTLTGLSTATALLLATRNLPPFTAAVLAIAAAVELSACFNHWLRERWLAAVLSDLSVLLLTYIAARPGGVPEGYASIAPAEVLAAQLALLAIYLGSTIVRTLVREFTITGFETAQCVATFLICLEGVLRVHRGDRVAATAAGLFLLTCGAACYTIAYLVLERKTSSHRNFHIYSLFALVLVLSGSRTLLDGAVLAAAWGAAGVAGVWLGQKSGKATLEWHGIVYLLFLAASSGIASWCGARFLGKEIGWVSPGLAGWIAAGALLLAYASAGKSAPRSGTFWDIHVRPLALATGALWCAAGLGVAAATAICLAAAGEVRTAAICPTLRTAVLTCLAVALAWAGKRWQRPELSWLVYPLMVFTAYKLLVQDLQESHKLGLFASLLLYGGALMVLPRILQTTRSAVDAPSQ